MIKHECQIIINSSDIQRIPERIRYLALKKIKNKLSGSIYIFNPDSREKNQVELKLIIQFDPFLAFI